jgi:hypothetical protein
MLIDTPIPCANDRDEDRPATPNRARATNVPTKTPTSERAARTEVIFDFLEFSLKLESDGED